MSNITRYKNNVHKFIKHTIQWQFTKNDNRYQSNGLLSYPKWTRIKSKDI